MALAAGATVPRWVCHDRSVRGTSWIERIDGIDGIAGIAGIALGGLALGCGSSVDAAALEHAVRANLRDQGLDVASLSCPAEALPVQCEAALPDGTVLAMRVTADGEKMTVASVDPIVVVERLVPEVRAKLEGVGHAVASVRCDGLVWRTDAGAVGRCEMVDADGARWIYEATFTGDGSQHRAAIYAAAGEVPG